VVEDETGEYFGVDLGGEEKERRSVANERMKKGKKVLEGCDGLVGEEDVGAF
jgi:hypothetical protein